MASKQQRTWENVLDGVLGVLSMCLDWMELEYWPRLGGVDGPDDLREEAKADVKAQIEERVKGLGSSVEGGFPVLLKWLQGWDGPLLMEVRNNLDACQTDEEARRYIFGFLRHFWRYADTLHPEEETRSYGAEIAMTERWMEFCMNGVDAAALGGEEVRAIEECKEEMALCKQSMERGERVVYEWHRMLGSHDGPFMKDGTIEHLALLIYEFVDWLGDALDAVLLERGHNLLEYQEESGICIVKERNMDLLAGFLDTPKLVQWYIERAKPRTGERRLDTDKRTEAEQRLNGEGMPSPDGENGTGPRETPLERFMKSLTETQKDRVRKYFPRAVENGYMRETEDGFRWQGGRGQRAQRAFFLSEVLKPLGYEVMPEKDVCALFGAKRKSIGRDACKLAERTKDRAWMPDMRKKIFFD